jgi:hypothetical protein
VPFTTVTAGSTITASWSNANVRDQVVTPFASAAARTSAVTSPVTGMLSYRTDGAVFDGYDGANWVTAGRFSVIARKTANETVNNSATLQNDDALLWSVATNGIYHFDLNVAYSSGTTPDLKFAWTYPAGLTMTYSFYGYDTSGALITVSTLDQTSTAALGGTGAGDARAFRIVGYVAGTYSAGTLQFQWAQNTANASDTIVYAGSIGVLTRIS